MSLNDQTNHKFRGGHDSTVQKKADVTIRRLVAERNRARAECARLRKNAARVKTSGGAGDAEETDVARLRRERDEYLDLARRERADLENYRKRTQREMQSLKRDSLGSFLKEFFGPLDDFDRVLAESSKDHSFDVLIEGVRILRDNLHKTLANAGVKKINAKGKPFDPAMHEAMAMVPSKDCPPNTVLEVYENGYRLDDFLLRPARVIVSSKPAEA